MLILLPACSSNIYTFQKQEFGALLLMTSGFWECTLPMKFWIDLDSNLPSSGILACPLSFANSNLGHKLHRLITAICLWTKTGEGEWVICVFWCIMGNDSFQHPLSSSWMEFQIYQRGNPWVLANSVGDDHCGFRSAHTVSHSFCETSHSQSLSVFHVSFEQRHWPGLLFSKVKKYPQKHLHHWPSMSRS